MADVFEDRRHPSLTLFPVNTRTIARNSLSYWIDSTPETGFSQQLDGVHVDVAIVGGGIAGLTAAVLLKQMGKTVAVVEAKRIATGVSGHTTAKVTSLHQLVYNEITQQHGADAARIYAESNQAALEQVAHFVEDYDIDCDFSRKSAYTFAEDEDTLKQVKKEAEAAQRAGLPVEFVTETPLPFPVLGAIRLDGQAQFHVRKYLIGLASTIPGEGSYIFDNSRVKTVKEANPCRVETEHGSLSATDVLVTTHLPILDQGLYFAKNYPKRSYIIAAKIGAALEGMFIGTGSDYYSIRTTPYGGGTLLLVGGKGHKTGHKSDNEGLYQQLETYAKERFGVAQFEYRWSTQDMVSFDKLPYIGKLTPTSNHIYTATGFSLWGMTKGTLAGMILSDLVAGRANAWAKTYDSLRVTPFVTTTSVQENLNVGTRWVGDRLKGLTHFSYDAVEQGEGKHVTVNGEKVAAYRDADGKIHAVSAVCPHLGCIVNWNSAEKSWDCPCHGARFDADGRLLHGPAVSDLAAAE